jgi:hypothetical protein
MIEVQTFEELHGRAVEHVEPLPEHRRAEIAAGSSSFVLARGDRHWVWYRKLSGGVLSPVPTDSWGILVAAQKGDGRMVLTLAGTENAVVYDVSRRAQRLRRLARARKRYRRSHEG